ncbi:MAG TPA: ECF-type sigma factor [Gemmatales bacterium]|nr:ECF-type sigma factor [Gemmatales bacterium]HMP60588.1 ECF-type sigma factor [Gemmatales bacterium]
MPLVYEELRGLAAAKLAREAAGQTLQPTALVHEAFLRLAEGEFANRPHFLAAAAEAMRRILVDHARAKQAQKRGGQGQRLDLDQEPAITPPLPPAELLALDEALTRLAQEDERAAELVKLHIYVGLSLEEAAEMLGFSRASAYREWDYARAHRQVPRRQLLGQVLSNG